MDGVATQGPAVTRPSKPREVRPQFTTIMDFLRQWRGDDHEDNIIMSRNRVIEIIEGVDALRSQLEWHPIETAPKNEMFIWAAPKDDGKWGLGLAYWNVSGGWSDAYGGSAPSHATRWAPLPTPPRS